MILLPARKDKKRVIKLYKGIDNNSFEEYIALLEDISYDIFYLRYEGLDCPFWVKERDKYFS